mmetsp:Transcript_28604/g.69743  ORF Transcript_28604/g.69743 Transcript_28604/m.69743 type:complete len:680 (+) Transcript_28604:153-2192(+)
MDVDENPAPPKLDFSLQTKNETDASPSSGVKVSKAENKIPPAKKESAASLSSGLKISRVENKILPAKKESAASPSSEGKAIKLENKTCKVPKLTRATSSPALGIDKKAKKSKMTASKRKLMRSRPSTSTTKSPTSTSKSAKRVGVFTFPKMKSKKSGTSSRTSKASTKLTPRLLKLSKAKKSEGASTNSTTKSSSLVRSKQQKTSLQSKRAVKPVTRSKRVSVAKKPSTARVKPTTKRLSKSTPKTKSTSRLRSTPSKRLASLSKPRTSTVRKSPSKVGIKPKRRPTRLNVKAKVQSRVKVNGEKRILRIRSPAGTRFRKGIGLNDTIRRARRDSGNTGLKLPMLLRDKPNLTKRKPRPSSANAKSSNTTKPKRSTKTKMSPKTNRIKKTESGKKTKKQAFKAPSLVKRKKKETAPVGKDSSSEKALKHKVEKDASTSDPKELKDVPDAVNPLLIAPQINKNANNDMDGNVTMDEKKTDLKKIEEVKEERTIKGTESTSGDIGQSSSSPKETERLEDPVTETDARMTEEGSLEEGEYEEDTEPEEDNAWKPMDERLAFNDADLYWNWKLKELTKHCALLEGESKLMGRENEIFREEIASLKAEKKSLLEQSSSMGRRISSHSERIAERVQLKKQIAEFKAVIELQENQLAIMAKNASGMVASSKNSGASMDTDSTTHAV